ncbi:serine/threonine protein kinase [Dolosigranulum pigrum]|uniref:non-specific serine/threonine protein kinase n=1 Tax=Dolosigranulum pigrum TaxID=29394 RepID=A0A1S8KLQ8_9LACT|nr:serine/threonine protein kinase [Dolosigranulum pigrum]
METGQRINGRYEVKRLLGSGGMAEVFLAYDLILDRQVAVKMLAYNFKNDRESLRRFTREATSTTELMHPNIVNIYDVGEAHVPYIVMEYIGGTDLKEYINRHHPIAHQTVVSIMDKILSAISYAHSQGVIHRDIKPYNILIDEKGTVKITDFGIALALSQNSLTQTNSLLGSVHYISPEQARGAIATKASDIYSLGILLYELLTGTVPFKGESAVSIALKHFQNDFPSVRDQQPSIPQALENVILKATAKDPNHRYSSVEAMREDLQTVLDPSRRYEEKFLPPNINADQTKRLTPIAPVVADDNSAEEAVKTYNPTSSATTDMPEAPATSKKKSKWWVWLLFLLIMPVAFVYFVMMSAPGEVDVPNLMGYTVAQVQAELDALNLEVGEVINQPDDEIAEGQVIKSDPASGASVKEGQAINLFVSSGQEPITLENYTNKDFNQMKAQLTELGFRVEREDVYHDTIEHEKIVSQDIEAGREVVPGETTITFEVSLGPEGFPFKNLAGYSRTGVEDYIGEHQLNATIEEAYSSQVPEGQVISQRPEPGTLLYKQSDVAVVFSIGPEPVKTETFERTIKIDYVPTADESQEDDDDDERSQRRPNKVRVYISDADHNMEEPVHSFDSMEDTELTLKFTVEKGKRAKYRVVVDGNIVAEQSVSSH